MMSLEMGRRDFLKTSTVAAVAGLGGGAVSAIPELVHAANPRGPIVGGGGRELRRGGMLYRRLGSTELFLSVLGFGSHTNPQYKRRSKLGTELTAEGQAKRDRRIARAIDRGVNLFDVYNNGSQWLPMSQTVKGCRDKVHVSLCRQLPGLLNEIVDDGARLFGGYVDLFRIYLGDGPGPDEKAVEDWDVLRKAKAAGKVRAIGVSTHSQRMMIGCLEKLDGLDYLMFPYNFIHARADYADFLPKAIRKGVGLIAIKPLAAGSIVKLDPRAKPGSVPENSRVQVYDRSAKILLPEVARRLSRSLNQLPDETLAQAALRFVYSRPFITSAMPGMFQEHELDDNYAALSGYLKLTRHQERALKAARSAAACSRGLWLPPHYRWLDEQWRV